MFDIFGAIEENLTRGSPIKTNRIPTHMPSKAMCNSATDGKPLGTCLRSSYFSVKKYPTSNAMGIYVTMTAEAGKLWESWLTDQYKQLGIYLDHSVKLYDPENFISGEIDIVHYNPLTNDIELTECKQYNGSNYYAALELKGTRDKHPKPKDQNLLQTFDYLLMCRNTKQNVTHSNLVYIDRSCGAYNNNVQFRISLTTVNNEVYPKIEYLNNNKEVEYYIDYRITEKAVIAKNALLDHHVDTEKIPKRDFQHTYPPHIIEDMLVKKEITETRYKKYKENPVKNPIGDWQCKFCPYGPNLEGESTCYKIKD